MQKSGKEEEESRRENSENIGCLLHQFIGVTNRDGQVRAAKISQSGEIHANYLAFAIEEWCAGSACGGRRIVNNLVSEDFADVSLGSRWANKMLCCLLRNNLAYLVSVA